MDPNVVAAWAAALAATAAAIVALVSLPFTIRAANAARAQTALQQAMAEAAAQPYVWADIQPDMKQGTLLQVVIGNQGPTVATNIRVTFDPPLPTTPLASASDAAQAALTRGIKSLAPGRRIEWIIGRGFDVLNGEHPLRYTVTVTADGPQGPVPRMVYDVDLADLRRSRDAPDGSLHLVRKSIDDLGKHLESLTRAGRLQVDAEVHPADEAPAE